MDIIEKINEISNQNGWFGRHEDFVDACNEEGLEVAEINGEYAIVTEEDDDGCASECVVYFGGTERTIIIERVREAW